MITADTPIEEIVEQFPWLVRPLREHGIVCIACGEPVWGTLREQAEAEGVQGVDQIVVEMNTLIAEREET